MHRRVPALCLAALFSGVPGRLQADDQPFLTLYATDIDSQGEHEAEQWVGWKTGASYVDFLSRTELESGITDDLQGSLYIDYDWQRVRSHGSSSSSETESVGGVSGELIYRILNADFEPVGLAFYLEPSLSGDQREIESKILVQKNFLNDTVRCAFNVNFEDDWDRENDGWERHGAVELDGGAAYAVTPTLSAGLELDNERTFDGLVMGGAAREQASAYFLGPTIDFELVPWKIAVGGQAQLPWASSTADNPGAVIDGFEFRAERFRFALRVSRDF